MIEGGFDISVYFRTQYQNGEIVYVFFPSYILLEQSFQTLFLKTVGTVFIQMNYLRKAIYIFFALNSCIFSVSSYIFYSRFVLFRNIKIFLHFSFLSFLCFGLLFSLPSPPTGSLRLPLFSLPSTYTACLDRGVELASFSNLREERYRYRKIDIYIERWVDR